MKEKITDILKEYKRSFSFEELDSLLGIKTIEETKELIETLSLMEKNGDIYRSNKDRYMSFEDSNIKKGALSINKKGFGFVNIGTDKDIYIPEEDLKDALDSDVVIISIDEAKKEGKIVRVLQRGLTEVIGEYYTKKNKSYLKMFDNKTSLTIEILPKSSMGAVDGHIVVVKIESIENKSFCKGKVTKILGHKNDPGVDILGVVEKYKIKYEFNNNTIKELDNIPEEVKDEERVDRRDLTNEEIFTIDGDDTKDIDDAISIQKLDNGNIKLGVHIADVSYYVKENSPIDIEALERGTSVYLVDRVIPMLPHKLSNGICSLNPGCDRLALSCVMEIDSKGEIVDYDIFQSIINSKIQMTYTNVNKVLEKNVIPDGYQDYANSLYLMKDLADILRKRKNNRGYIDFDVDEAKIIVDEECRPMDIVLRERGTGEKIIEDYMIAANECVATHVFYMELPFLYRVHEEPKEEKIREFLSFVASLGYTISNKKMGITPKFIQGVLLDLKDKKEYKILSALLLRHMKKAVYMPQNLGHFGLASKCYTHFTAPIRRYPDLTVHRLLRKYLINADLSSGTISYWQEKLAYIAEHSSFTERNSIECEREVEDMKMAEYMEAHIGEEFDGRVSTIANFGMFVELDNLVEGLVHISDLNGYFDYDEENQIMVNEGSKEKYRLGDRLRVKVVRASKEERKIDFKIIKRL